MYYSLEAERTARIAIIQATAERLGLHFLRNQAVAEKKATSKQPRKRPVRVKGKTPERRSIRISDIAEKPHYTDDMPVSCITSSEGTQLSDPIAVAEARKQRSGKNREALIAFLADDLEIDKSPEKRADELLKDGTNKATLLDPHTSFEELTALVGPCLRTGDLANLRSLRARLADIAGSTGERGVKRQRYTA
jgi:hypothetical protein